MDGALVGQVAQDNPYTSGGVPLRVNGGNPMDLPSTVHLCTRFDDNPQRHFAGQLAYLGVPSLSIKVNMLTVYIQK